jgi:hypothetical protein
MQFKTNMNRVFRANTENRKQSFTKMLAEFASTMARQGITVYGSGIGGIHMQMAGQHMVYKSIPEAAEAAERFILGEDQ